MLDELEREEHISSYLRHVLVTLLSDKESTYDELIEIIDVYRTEMDKPISANIKLEDGPLFVKQTDLEKSYNLRRLS